MPATMFCSSLRQNRLWSANVSELLKAPSPGWKEARLDGHNFAFPLGGDLRHTFKVLLLSTGDQKFFDFSQKVERLYLLNGGCDVAVILLMEGKDSIFRFIQLQTELLHGTYVPVLPISAPSDLMPCLNNLRRSQEQPRADNARTTRAARSRDALAHCVQENGLTSHQVNILTDITPSLQGLVRDAVDGHRQQQLADYIGEADSRRITAFFLNSPSSTSD